MKAKKNPKHDVKRNSTLYFLIGLTAVLCMSYTVIEYKTFYEESEWEPDWNEPDEIAMETPPIVKLSEPPKPKYIPPIIEILPDTSDEPESVVEIPEVDQSTEITSIQQIDFVEPPIDEEVIFINVEKKPIFPGCESASDKYVCFQEMMQKHIRKNFKYPEEAIDMNQQGKVYVQFTIQKDGSIGNLSMRGPYKILETEAERIILKLPKMTPGKQRGTPVRVPFSIPINFVLQ